MDKPGLLAIHNDLFMQPYLAADATTLQAPPHSQPFSIGGYLDTVRQERSFSTEAIHCNANARRELNAPRTANPGVSSACEEADAIINSYIKGFQAFEDAHTQCPDDEIPSEIPGLISPGKAQSMHQLTLEAVELQKQGEYQFSGPTDSLQQPLHQEGYMSSYSWADSEQLCVQRRQTQKRPATTGFHSENEKGNESAVKRRRDEACEKMDFALWMEFLIQKGGEESPPVLQPYWHTGDESWPTSHMQLQPMEPEPRHWI